MPNLVAYLALIIWPFVSFIFFRRMQTVPALIWTILGGFLILPVKVAIDLPMIPALDKESIVALSALIGCIFIKKEPIKLIPESGLEKKFFIILLILPLITSLTNSEAVFDGDKWISGLTYYDAISAILRSYIRFIPFLLGLQLIKTFDDQLFLFKFLVIGALIYSIPIFIEVRLSPQMHTWVYGFFPHSFLQQVRFDGYRPVVFLGHGLTVAIYLSICLAAATLLWKNNTKVFSLPPLFVVIYLFGILILCKSVAPFLYSLVLISTIAWFPNFIAKRMTMSLVILILLYPLLSTYNLFPHQAILDFAYDFSPDRASSLEFRFYHEGLLLEHAKDKILFGWGGWGRSTFYNSVTDGTWIIILGSSGILGFLAYFGLALLSCLRAMKASELLSGIEQRFMSGHFLLVSIILVDQLPNSSMKGYIWLIIGGLLGRANYLIKNKHSSPT